VTRIPGCVGASGQVPTAKRGPVAKGETDGDGVVSVVDVAKTTFVAERAAEGVASGDAHLGQFSNDASGFAELAVLISRTELDAASVVHLVLEPTGGYELALVSFAHAQGWQVSLPNPRQVRNWAKGTGQRAKNDRQDARLLAHYGASCQACRAAAAGDGGE